MLIAIVIAIIIYRNRKVTPESLECKRFVQFDGEHANVEHYMDYVSQKLQHLAIVIVHHPRNKLITIKDRKFKINLYDSSNIMSGYHTTHRKLHEIYINKRYYMCVDSKNYTINKGEAEVTRIVCVNSDFQHVKFTIFVCTSKASDEYIDKCSFTRAFNIFKFIAGEIKPDENFMIFGEFGCQNWDFIRQHVLPQLKSTGEFDVPSRKSRNVVTCTHGLIVSGGMSGAIKITTRYIDTLYSSNELLWSCKYITDFKCTSTTMLVSDESYKISCAINSKSSDTNYMLNKAVPVLSDIDSNFDVSVDAHKTPIKAIQIEDALSYILQNI